MKSYWVYLLTNRSGTLYIGVTSDLARRVAEHKSRTAPDSFTARYALDRLIYCEEYPSAADALAREKQLKGWRRTKKVALVNAANPAWRDLAEPQRPGATPNVTPYRTSSSFRVAEASPTVSR